MIAGILSAMTIATVLRKAHSFVRYPNFIKLWLVPVWVLLGFSRLLVLTIPFRRLAPRLGRHQGANPWVPVLSRSQEDRALAIGRAVRLAARYTPWTSNCFPQAVAARLLLGLYGIPYVLYFGLARDPESAAMKAHAWVAAGRIRVTGGASFRQFTVVGCFVAPRLAAGPDPR